MSAVIFATSAAGKSHFANRAYGPAGVRVVDGDDTIASFKAWPKEKFWWTLSSAPGVHTRHGEILKTVLERNRDLVVVFNTNMQIVVPVLRSIKIAPPVLLYVDLPNGAIRRNWHLREAMIKKGVSRHSHRPLESYIEGAEKQRKYAAELGLVSVPSFEVAAKRLHLYLKSKAD
jgi:hypothetical protein